MSAINISTQIPNSIVTLEQHIAWAGLTLGRINPTAGVLEAQNRTESVVQTAIFTAADDTTRLLVRASLELDPAFMSNNSKKLWMFVREFSNVAIPAAFTQN